jgi:amino acid adenylation domain-containing protein/non-ribosomal peptide synthase protein (TIGR01720 family)
MPTAVSNLVTLVQQRGHERPADPAYVFLSGGDLRQTALSYGQLDLQARTIAGFLQGLRLQGERALLLYPPGLEFIAAFLGCLYAGVVAVPAYPPRINRNALRILSIAEDCQASLVLTTAAVASRFSALTAQMPELGKIRWISSDSLQASADDWHDFSPMQDDVAYLQYTSGSTAAPRGVMVTHGNIVHNSAYIAAGFEHTGESVSLCWLPHFHDMGLIDGVIQPLYSGFTGYLMAPASFLQEPVRWLQAISRFGVTHSGGPNFAYDLCSAKIPAEQRERLDLSTWKVAYNGAEPIHAQTMELFAGNFGPCGFRDSAFYPAYGLAEATLKVSGGKRGGGALHCTVKARELERNHVEVTHADDPEGRTLVGAGNTAHGMRALVVDPESQNECVTGQVGEIWICGPSVARGYWNRQEETREAFAAVVKSCGEGPFLRTGDLGFIYDNQIFVTGRLKDLMIIRGRNHHPQDIERTVQSSHPLLGGMPGAAFSLTVEREERLAFVQEIDPRRSNVFARVLEEIRRAVTGEHEIQPYAILLVKPGAVPRTSSGKVQHHLCRQKFLDNSFTVLAEWREPIAVGAEAPDELMPLEFTSDGLRLWLRAKLAAKLGMDISKISPHQPIHQLALDSLMALELTHTIESAVGVSFSQTSWLEAWSIDELAQHILSRLVLNSSPGSDTTGVSYGKAATEYPLSQGQQALWLLQQLAPDSHAYYIARALRLKNEVDIAALRRAFQMLVDRHSSLRTVFRVVDGRPLQKCQESPEVFFEYKDASDWDAIELQQRLRDAASRSFDLCCGPLFRVFLFSRSARDHVLLLALHHIVADLWSLGLVLKELSETYAAEIGNAAAELTALPVCYADYVNWEERLLQAEEGERHRQYWLKQLEGTLPFLELPIDFPRPPAQTYNGALKFARFDADLVCRLRSTAIDSRTTVFAVLIAAFETFLHRYTGEKDVLVGTPTTGRSRHEFAGIVGYFVNSVVVRLDLSGDLNFAQIVTRARRTVLEALEHQAFPFATLVQRLQPRRDPSRSPLFQTMFALQKTDLLPSQDFGALAVSMEGKEVRLGDLVFESVPLEHKVAQFDLTLAMAETDGQMVASFEYNTDLFEDATVDRMIHHFDHLLRQCIACPERAIGEISLLSDAERRRVVADWNQTQRKYSPYETALEPLEAQADRTPENPAVMFDGTSFSYRELHQRANQIAHFLRKLGVGPDVRVGVCMERSAQLVTALLGILKAGGAYVPLEPGYPAERLSVLLNDARPAVVLADKAVLLKETLPHTAVRTVCLEDEWATIGDESRERLESRVSAENVAYLIYTSGSTGKPKGVMTIHRGLLNRLQWMQEAYGLEEQDRVLQKTPFGFDVSVWEFFWPLMYGAAVVVARPEGHKDSRYLVQTIQREAITTVHFVPSMLRMFLQETGVEGCNTLRRVIASGEALSVPLVENFHKCLRVELHNLYGPTEASIDVSFYECFSTIGTSVPIGRPIANTQLYILDCHLQPLPVGVTGELYVGGVGLARGYWRRAEMTAEKFIPHPFCNQAGERLYRTGDLARWRADGNIEYLGRSDDQIKLRGFRIEVGEIENVLAQHEAVQQAVVVAQEYGQDKRLIAYVVPAWGSTPQPELRSYAERKLPEYMVPSAFVTVPALPLSANGKVNRKALPRWEFGTAEQKTEQPRTSTEELLEGIWSSVLAVTPIGIRNNFFELGGHSLLAAQVVSRVRETLLVDLPLQAIFEKPTIAGLAEYINVTKRGSQRLISAPISHRERYGEAPLSFAQERMWFLHQIISDKSAYNIIEGVQLSGDLDPIALEASFSEIIRRHEILRAGFVAVEGTCVQRIDAAPEWRLEQIDISTKEVHQEVKRLVREETRKVFDLERAPLFRAAILKCAEREHILLLAMHHIVADGWSFGVLMRELMELYATHAAKREAGLDELKIQYADYAEWQRQELKDDALEDELAYWKERLYGVSPQSLLPTDYSRPCVQTFRGKRYRFELSKDLTDCLKESSRQQGVTLFMALLTAAKVLLARYSGQRDVVIGTVVANRNRRELEKVIGLFANTLVLRTDLTSASSITDALKRVRDVCIESYFHQELPFEKLVAELKPERDLGSTPIFQVMFAWQSLPVDDLQTAGLMLKRLPVEEECETTKFDLSFLIGESHGRLLGVIEYSSDLFEARTIERMFIHYRGVLEAIVQDSSQNVWRIALLNDSERQQILVEWNDTRQEFPRVPTVVNLIEHQAELRPLALAVRDQEKGLSYQELNRQANQWAHRLQKLGVQTESRVGICMERGVEMVAVQLGVLKAGGAYIPLDQEHPAGRLRYQISDSGAKVVISGRSSVEKLRELEQVQVVCVEEECDMLRCELPTDPDWISEEQQLAYVIYTSGSTGRPKGVEIGHAGLLNLVQWHQQAYAIGPGERGSLVAGVGFDASVWETWPYLAAGATLEIPGEEERTSTERLREWLTERGITTAFLPTPLAEAAMRLEGWKPQCLKRILTGGDRLRERPPLNWDVEVLNHYGPTECTVVATAAAVERSGAKLPLIGRPISNTRVYVLDEEMEPVPVGVAGELYIGGAGLARGYAGNPELTAERFVPDAISGETGKRLYRTGDQCRWTWEGDLEFIGRRDQQVKIHGYRIEIGEIEAVLKEHDGVLDAVVAVQENKTGAPSLIAYVVTDPGQTFKDYKLREYLQGRLPNYMFPSAFMRLESIPRTASGKADRQALKKWDFTSRRDQEEPRNDTEKLFAEIWTALLRVEQVGIHDNFFELGGDSIISLQVVARAKQQGTKITPRQVFEYPTIAALAAVAESAADSEGISHRTAAGHEAELTPMYPLSPMQKGILFEYLSAQESGAYIQQLICTVRGRLDIEAFQNAWQQVVARHPALRTAFIWGGGDEPLQVVRPYAGVPFELRDWSGLSGSAQQQQSRSLLAEDRVRGFTVSEAPLLRLTLLQVAPDVCRLLFTFHHLILDGWSLPLLFRDVLAHYGERIGGEPYQAPPVVPYSDYIQWLQKQDFTGAETYWRRALQGLGAPANIAIDSTGQSGESDGVFFEQQIQLSSQEAARMQSAAREQGLTLSIFVQAAWALLLSRYSDEQDIVFGLTVSGRSANLPGVEAMIGLFINTLPVRTFLNPEQQLLSWLKELQMRQTELTQYEHTPLSQIQKWSDVPAGTRLFESIVIFENYPLDASLLKESNGLTIEDVQSVEITNYPLTVTAIPHANLQLLISYDRRSFDDAAVTRMLGHIKTILLSMATGPQQLVREVAWITPGERSQLLVDWNRTAANHSPEQCVHAMFEEQVRRTPEDIAVIFGDQQLTYAELDQRANQLANYLRCHGIRPEVHVGLCLERSLEMVVGILGILKAGGIYTPVDSSWPSQRKSFVLAETGAPVLLTSKDARVTAESYKGRIISLDSEWQQISRQPLHGPATPTDPDNLAYVIYTSGTTGKPKGVTIRHRALCNHLRWMQVAFPLEPQDRFPQKYPLGFDVSLLEVFYPLLAGAQLVVAPPMRYFDSTILLSFLIENQITAIDLVPSILQALLRDPGFSALTQLRRVTCGGDVLSPDLQEQFFSRSSAELANLYGPTETTIGSTFWQCHRGEERLSVPIGRPISNTEMYILDRHMDTVPVGVTGELYIGGMGLARGYLCEPAVTAERFVPHSYSRVPGERLYRTGDLGRYRADGSIEYIGRADDQLKIRGFRIEPGEIEAALRVYPGVRDVIVLAHEQRLVAYVAGAQVNQNDLRRHLKERLPEYMLPAFFVWLDTIPVLANGKVDRRALSVLKPEHTKAANIHVAPQTSMEQALAAIWETVFKVGQVGIEDNFFELGGDSILSLQVVTRAQQQGIRITPRQVFEYPTIAALAAVSERMKEESRESREQTSVEGEVELTPIQRWFFEQELEESHHYNQAVLLEADEELNSEWLEAAWKKMVEHHDALRLRYRQEGGKWRQRNAGREENRFFEVVDPKGEEDQRNSELKRVIERMQKSLDLQSGPLLRVAHVNPGRMVVVIHHLVVDSVSWRILVEDVERAYAQARRGEEIKFPAKTVSYQRWATELKRRAEAGSYVQEREYWLRDEKEQIERMPRDWEGGENCEAGRSRVKVELDDRQTRQLLQEVPRAYHTQIQDVLLTAVMSAWEKWTGKQRLVIDVEGHGREGEDGMDVSRTVGWFTAVYPVRLQLQRGKETGERLKEIKEGLRKVPGLGLGYGVLRYVNQDQAADQRAEERLRRQGQAEISFNYLGQVDGVVGQGIWRRVQALEENSRGGRNRRSHVLEVEGRVEGGRLQVWWNYSRDVHREDTIAAVAGNFLEELKEIIEHCVAPGTGGFTPSDFPLARLDQHSLDLLTQSHQALSDIYPLSPIQQGLLFHTLYDGSHSGTYVEQLSCILTGNVNVQAFEQAWQQVIDSHPALRTVFVWEGLQEPLQIVLRSARARFLYPDLGELSIERQPDLDKLRRADTEQGFDLSTPPLMRFTLVHLGGNRFEFLWSSHHLLLDGWGMSLVLQEVLERYAALCAGTSFASVSRRPYRDYIAWVRRQDLAKAKEYWQDLLRRFTVPVPLPGRHSVRSANADERYRDEQLRLSRDTTTRLQTFARHCQITLSVLVQAAWAVLLKHYTRERDLLFGVTVSGRPPELAGIDRMVGVFINTLPVRLTLTPAASVISILEELQARQLQLDEYAYTPLLKIHEWSEVPAGVPLFETVVVFENYPVDASLKEPRGELKFHNVRSKASTNYPLTLIIKPAAQTTLQLTYDSRRFEPGMVDQLLRHLQNLLVSMTVDPLQQVGDLQPISKIEREQLLVQWNSTEREYPREQCIQQLFEEQVRRAPQDVALILQGQKLSYADVNQRANQLAHYLRKRGVGSEDRVAVFLERSFEMIVALLGIVKAGGAYVALDPGSPRERLEAMLAESQSKAVLTQEQLRDRLPQECSAQIVCMDEHWATIARESSENPGIAAASDNLAYVSYTSGSTGKPKGVSIPHRAVVRLVKNNDYAELDAAEVFLQFAALPFDASTLEIWGSLLNGARLVIMPPGPCSTEEIATALVEHEVTVLWLTAGLFQVMVDEQLEKLRQVRQVLAGGDVLSVPHVNRYLAAMQENTVLINGYGPTENTTFTCCYRMTKREPIEATVPIGMPIANTQAYVLDDEMQPVAVGMVGELYIGGEGLARGYENDVELTAERFLPHPHGAMGQRLYRSGDEVRYREDGVLEFVGRNDRQMKIRGYRVEPAEIERVLGRHAAVREVAVMAHEKQNGEKLLVAYIVMQPDQKVSIPDLQTYLKTRLADYMRPAALMPLERLPLTRNGKIDYKALPRPEISGISGAGVLPRTAVEHALAEIWSEVFGLERLGVNDNFFDRGGHSLRALQIASRVRTVLGVSVPLRVIFEEPTIASQARMVEQLLASGNGSSSAAICPSPRPDNLPLSFAQQRLWFLHQLEPKSDFYNVPIALRIRGPLNVNVLSDCCNEIVRRHEVLRTSFPIREGVPVQQIGDPTQLSLRVTNLDHLATEQTEAASLGLVSKEAQQPFDLSCGPLLRLSLLRLARDHHLLLWNMHHIIVDGWSFGVIVRELAALYEAFLAGGSSPLAPLPIQYADYALWQRKWLKGETLESQLAYWRQRLSSGSILELATDYPRPKVQTFKGAKKSIHFSRQFVESLRKLVRQENSTLFIALLAGLKVLLHRYTGQPEITVGTPVAGRSHREIEPLIGFFVNTLALRSKVFGHPRFTEFLREVREACLTAYANQDVPFDKLVEELRPNRDSGLSPFFQVMFAFDDTAPQELALPGLQVSAVEVESPTAKFDLTLSLHEAFEGMLVSFQYNSDLFQEATIDRMAQHFQRLLHGIVTNPKQHISEISLLTEEECDQVTGWNQTEREYPRNETVLELLETQLAKTPEHPAVVFEDKCLSYRELHARANQLAQFLRAAGIGPEMSVGVCLERSELLVTALLGIMKAGAAYVPLESSLPVERLALMIEDSQARLLLTQQSLRNVIPSTTQVECLDADWHKIAEHSHAAVERSVTGENPAYVIYTSGSTGTPKGVVITHRGLHNHMAWMREEFPLDAAERVLQKTVFSFDASVWEFWAPLMAGAVLVMARPGGHRDPAYLIECISKEQITVLQLTPTQLRMLMEQNLDEDCHSLKRVYCGGEALTQDIIEEFCRRLPWAKLYNLYGPTEATIDAMFNECLGSSPETPAAFLGKPISNTQTYVLDQSGALAPIGAPGELCLGGAGLARGYLGQPGLTAEHFVPDPYSKVPGSRLYRTGDCVRWRTGGELEFLGRIDNQVKLRGYRIELDEIRAVLSQYPEVSQAIVVMREDKPGEKRIIGYVVTRNGADDLFVCKLRDYVKTKLPEYMVPAIVQMDDLPLTVNGKIDYNGLATLSSVVPCATDTNVAPRNAIEEQIAKKCCDLLDIQRLGIHDNFFDLGGHSLLAMRLMTWARETFQIETLPPREFFEDPTIAGLAALTVRCEARPGQTEKIARFLQQLDAMSPEEVMAFRTKSMEPEAAQNAVSRQ